MSLGITLAVCATMLGTSFLSGIFGMAGGIILIGLLLVLLPVQAAMVLHGITQLASNVWRAVTWRKSVRWDIAGVYSCGSLIALGAWSLTGYVPDKAVSFLLLGVTPFMMRAVPPDLQPDPESRLQCVMYGMGCTGLILLTGVAGPMLDTFFLGGALHRRTILATKAVCQVLGHTVKLVYFAGVVAEPGTVDPLVAGLAVAMAALGTTLAKPVVDRLSDKVYRVWANRIVVTLSGYYAIYGLYLVAIPLI
jgi:uncharacterized membrane protein YfcA